MARTPGERRMGLVFRPHTGQAWQTARKVGFAVWICYSTSELRYSLKKNWDMDIHPTLMYSIPFWWAPSLPWRRFLLCQGDASAFPGGPAGAPPPAKQLSLVSSKLSYGHFLLLVGIHLPFPAHRLPAAAGWPLPPWEGVINPMSSGLAGIWGSSHWFQEADLS